MYMRLARSALHWFYFTSGFLPMPRDRSALVAPQAHRSCIEVSSEYMEVC